MPSDLLKRFHAGEALAASRLMTIVERGGDEAEAVLTTLFPNVGRAYRIGVTGPTGAGKSTLVSQLIRRYRARDLTVGVIAEDPTSPFSGGAILGDRVRMLDASGDEGVFIRSIASRGTDTGLSACAAELADVLDAFGRDIIFLETIGVGQLEYKIRFIAHTTLVVLTPEAGDDVQSLKSGLMEIGDIFVVNKADRPQSGRFADDLRAMLELRTPHGQWLAPVVATSAVHGDGIDDLAGAIESHQAYLAEDGRMDAKREESLRNQLAMVVEEKLKDIFWQNPYIKKKLDVVLSQVVSGKKSPYEAAREITSPLKIENDEGRPR